jgi:hypothetical protein
MTKLFASLIVASSLCGGCTANVENPTVNQQGRAGDTTCITNCDGANTSCVASCSDDVCKASCQTTHSSCVSSCAPKDGG